MVDNWDVEKLFNNIEEWINNNRIITPKFNYSNVSEILNESIYEISKQSSKEILFKAYALYEYLEHLQTVYNKENCVLNFTSESIWNIISSKIDSYGNDYSKGQKRNYNLAIKENILASKLFKLKMNAQSKLDMLSNRLEIIKKRADILYELSRRTQYE